MSLGTYKLLQKLKIAENAINLTELTRTKVGENHMQLPNVKRIIVEDFPRDSREIVAKLAGILNEHMEQVVNLSRKNVGIDNLNRAIITIEITVDANGIPQGVNQINTTLNTYSGKNIVDVQSLKAGTVNVTSAPYLDCTPQGGGIVKINRFYGLPANTKLRVKIEFYG